MAADPTAVFSSLESLLATCAERLSVKVDMPDEYTLVTKSPSPFPQHKGHPMFFSSIRAGKAYVSLHLMPLYMCPTLSGRISPSLKRRIHGKTCFNFKAVPEPDTIAELKDLTEASLKEWASKDWL
jgi:hypothetical protein